MIIKEFIDQKKIKPVHAAGFLEYLLMEPERDVEKAHLEEAYRQFAGIPVTTLQRATNVTQYELDAMKIPDFDESDFVINEPSLLTKKRKLPEKDRPEVEMVSGEA